MCGRSCHSSRGVQLAAAQGVGHRRVTTPDGQEYRGHDLGDWTGSWVDGHARNCGLNAPTAISIGGAESGLTTKWRCPPCRHPDRRPRADVLSCGDRDTGSDRFARQNSQRGCHGMEELTGRRPDHGELMKERSGALIQANSVRRVGATGALRGFPITTKTDPLRWGGIGTATPRTNVPCGTQAQAVETRNQDTRQRSRPQPRHEQSVLKAGRGGDIKAQGHNVCDHYDEEGKKKAAVHSASDRVSLAGNELGSRTSAYGRA